MLGNLTRLVMPVFLLLLSLLTTACSSKNANFNLTIAHLNDSHSHLEPAAVCLTLGGEKTTAQLGGFARLKTVLDQARLEDPDLLLLHAGDAVQGTLYFTLFNGMVEYDFLNLLGVDAMTFGNHEFDRGTAAIPGWIKRSRFPWLSANIDFSLEPGIAPLVKPYLLKEIDGEQVAVIGITTETTPQTTINPGKAVFMDAVSSTRRQVAALTAQGVNKIVLLSHLGYLQDKALAAQVSGVDVIVGGHSHTLLGDPTSLSAIGLIAEGPYPTEVLAPDGKRVLVVQAWQWGDLLGRLKIAFTPDGEVSSWTGGALMPVGDTFSRDGVTVVPGTQPYREIVNTINQSPTARIVAEDPAVAAALAPYTAQLEQFRQDVVASAADDIAIGLNSGPGPLVADSMLAAVPRAEVALLNYGGVRKGLAAGKITVGDVLEVMPFANTLVLVDLSGAELKQALEEDIAFLIGKFGLSANAMPYLGGAVMTVQPTAADGSRVTALAIKDSNGIYRPLDLDKVYRIVTNAFVANGGDGFTPIKNAAGFRSDTGVIDSDAFRDHLKELGTVHNSTEQRINILKDAALLPVPAFGGADGYVLFLRFSPQCA